MKKACCYSREDAENLDPEEFGEFPCIISINEPVSQDGDSKLKNGWFEVLNMKFWDVVKPVDSLFISEHKEAPEIFNPIVEAEAKEIADFIKKNWDSSIAVHCRAGVSRSAAVVQVLKDLGWEVDQKHFDKRGFGLEHQNAVVVKLLREQFKITK